MTREVIIVLISSFASIVVTVIGFVSAWVANKNSSNAIIQLEKIKLELEFKKLQNDIIVSERRKIISITEELIGKIQKIKDLIIKLCILDNNDYLTQTSPSHTIWMGYCSDLESAINQYVIFFEENVGKLPDDICLECAHSVKSSLSTMLLHIKSDFRDLQSHDVDNLKSALNKLKDVISNKQSVIRDYRFKLLVEP